MSAAESKGAIEKLLSLADQRLDCLVRVEFHIAGDDEPIVCTLVAGSGLGTDVITRAARTAEEAAELVLMKFSVSTWQVVEGD